MTDLTNVTVNEASFEAKVDDKLIKASIEDAAKAEEKKASEEVPFDV